MQMDHKIGFKKVYNFNPFLKLDAIIIHQLNIEKTSMNEVLSQMTKKAFDQLCFSCENRFFLCRTSNQS